MPGRGVSKPEGGAGPLHASPAATTAVAKTWRIAGPLRFRREDNRFGGPESQRLWRVPHEVSRYGFFMFLDLLGSKVQLVSFHRGMRRSSNSSTDAGKRDGGAARCRPAGANREGF